MWEFDELQTAYNKLLKESEKCLQKEHSVLEYTKHMRDKIEELEQENQKLHEKLERKEQAYNKIQKQEEQYKKLMDDNKLNYQSTSEQEKRGGLVQDEGYELEGKELEVSPLRLWGISYQGQKKNRYQEPCPSDSENFDKNSDPTFTVNEVSPDSHFLSMKEERNFKNTGVGEPKGKPKNYHVLPE